MKIFFRLLLAALAASIFSACTLEDPIDACTPGTRKCEDAIFYECLLDGQSWDQMNCGNKAQFCHVAHICVDCNDDEDCQSDEKHCVDHLCQPLWVEACTEGTTKCEAGKSYTCIDKAWENAVICEEGCNIDGTGCMMPDAVCKTDATHCTNDGQLAVCKNNKWQFNDCEEGQSCPSDKTACEILVCEDDSRRCANNAVEVCSNNAWRVVQTCGDKTCNDMTYTCNAVLTCTDGTKRCANNAVEVCSNNAWTIERDCGDLSCNEISHSYVVVTPPPECDVGWKRCKGDVLEQCNAQGQYEAATSNSCVDRGLICLEDSKKNTAKCVECTDDFHCEPGTCNSTEHYCEFDVSTPFTWCQSKHIDSESQMAYGRVLDPRDVKDPSTIYGAILCGTVGETLEYYEPILGSYNPDCADCGEDFEFIADLSEVPNGDYLCLWAFIIDHIDYYIPTLCQSDGKVLSSYDFLNFVPTAAIALSLTVSK